MGIEELKAMTVADVLKTAEWKRHLEKVIDNLEQMRVKAANDARKADRKPVRMPIDYFIENDLLTADKVTEMYLAVLEKKEKKLSAMQRMFIMDLGFVTFRETMQELTEDHPELIKK